MGQTIECILYLMIFISYLVNIFSHLLIFTVILSRLRSNFIFSLLAVNLLQIS